MSIWSQYLTTKRAWLPTLDNATDDTRRVNLRKRWIGHLWQERFHSFAMDEAPLYTAVRYTELDPVRARLCQHRQDWPWSSVHAHLARTDDAIVMVKPMLQRVTSWKICLSEHLENSDRAGIRQHGRTGPPAGSDIFLHKLQVLSGRDLRKRKPGPKPAIR